MSKPVAAGPLALLLLAALAFLLLAAERGAAFRVGAPAGSRRHQRPQRQQQRPVRQASFVLGPLRSTTEDKAEPAAPTPADASAAAAPTPASIEAEAPAGPCKNFPKCDGSMRSKGCDGMGKIQGGIATVPFLGWWPIKAYRPCPAVIEAGYGYKRRGQTFGEFIEGKRRSDDDE